MSKFKDNFFIFINRIFKYNNLSQLPPLQSELLLKEIKNSRIIKGIERIINNDIDFKKNRKIIQFQKKK